MCETCGFLQCHAGGNSSLYNIRKRTPCFSKAKRTLKFDSLGGRTALKFYNAAFDWAPICTARVDTLGFLVLVFVFLGTALKFYNAAFDWARICTAHVDTLGFLALVFVFLSGRKGMSNFTWRAGGHVKTPCACAGQASSFRFLAMSMSASPCWAGGRARLVRRCCLPTFHKDAVGKRALYAPLLFSLSAWAGWEGMAF